MSVHGEYSRSLEWMVDALRESDRPERARWIAELESARVDANPDLSTAARVCLDALEAIETTVSSIAPGDALIDRYEHLLAHCRIVLGGRD